MKNLKRTLSLVLAVALCFSLLTMGASAKVYKDESSITYKEAVQWLSTLGIMGGELNSDGTYSARPADPITRAEFSKLVCVLMNGGTAPSLGTADVTSFKDTKGHWAASYIEFLYALGYIGGYGDGTFGLNDTITGQQAAKILLAVIGYNVAQEKLTGATWAFKADALASTNGLYSGLKTGFVSSSLLKREEAAQMIYNALDAEVVIYNDAGLAGLSITRGKTLLKTYFPKIIKVEGVVVANTYGSMLYNGTATDNSTYIMPVDTLKAADTQAKFEALSTSTVGVVSFEGNISSAEMLGQSVRFAYTENSVSGSAKKVLLSDITVTDYNKSYTTTAGGKIRETTIGMKLDCTAKEITTTNGSGLKTFTGPLTTYKTKIYNNYSYVQNRVAPDTSVAYYYYEEAYDYLRIDTTSNYNYLNAGSGWTTQFIDYNGDGDCDFVKVYSATPVKATYVSTAGIVTLKNLADGTTLGTYDKAKMFNKADGKAATIAQDDIFLATVDNANSKVYVSPLTKFTGKITSVAPSLIGPNTSYKISVDGTVYPVHDMGPNLDGSQKAVEEQIYIANGSKNKYVGLAYNAANSASLSFTTVAGATLDMDSVATFYKDANNVLCYIDSEDTEVATNVKFGIVTYAGGYDIGIDGQYIKLVDDAGVESVKKVTTIYVGSAFEDVENTAGYLLTDPATVAAQYPIAYTVKTDGSLKVYKMAATAVPGAALSTLYLDNDVAKIKTTGAANYLNAEGNAYLLTAMTKFVDVDDNITYTGYANTPNPAFTSATYMYIITTNDVNAASNKLSGGTATGSKTNVNFMFFYGESSGTTGDDVYFYVPNAGSYTSSYASDGTTKLRTYRAIVNGVVNTAFVVNVTDLKVGSSLGALASKKLYKISKYDSDAKTIKEVSAPIDITTAGGAAITDFNKNFIQVGGETYILNSKTVYINVTGATGFELVTYDFLNKNYNAYVNYDVDTYEALQVYVTKLP